MAHFLEHLVFKGGESYDDYRKVNETAERIGAMLNAYTSHDIVAFHITCRAEVARRGDRPADGLRRPPADRRGGARPRARRRHPGDRARARQPVGRRRAPDRPRRLRRPSARAAGARARRSTCAPSRARRSSRSASASGPASRGGAFLVGNVDHLPCDDVLADAFGRFPSLDADGGFEPAPALEPVTLVEERDSNQSHLRMSYRPSIDVTSLPERAALTVFSTLLGGSMGSRLFDEIREQRGLAYSVYSLAHAFADVGVLQLSAGLESGKCVEAYARMREIVDDLRDERPARGGGRAGPRLRRRPHGAVVREHERGRPPRRRPEGRLRPRPRPGRARSPRSTRSRSTTSAASRRASPRSSRSRASVRTRRRGFRRRRLARTSLRSPWSSTSASWTATCGGSPTASRCSGRCSAARASTTRPARRRSASAAPSTSSCSCREHFDGVPWLERVHQAASLWDAHTMGARAEVHCYTPIEYQRKVRALPVLAHRPGAAWTCSRSAERPRPGPTVARRARGVDHTPMPRLLAIVAALTLVAAAPATAPAKSPSKHSQASKQKSKAKVKAKREAKAKVRARRKARAKLRRTARFDWDHDGLVNRYERMVGTRERVADTDGDGVSDGREDHDGDLVANATEQLAKTDPRKPDSDRQRHCRRRRGPRLRSPHQPRRVAPGLAPAPAPTPTATA